MSTKIQRQLFNTMSTLHQTIQPIEACKTHLFTVHLLPVNEAYVYLGYFKDLCIERHKIDNWQKKDLPFGLGYVGYRKGIEVFVSLGLTSEIDLLSLCISIGLP